IVLGIYTGRNEEQRRQIVGFWGLGLRGNIGDFLELLKDPTFRPYRSDLIRAISSAKEFGALRSDPWALRIFMDALQDPLLGANAAHALLEATIGDPRLKRTLVEAVLNVRRITRLEAQHEASESLDSVLGDQRDDLGALVERVADANYSLGAEAVRRLHQAMRAGADLTSLEKELGAQQEMARKYINDPGLQPLVVELLQKIGDPYGQLRQYSRGGEDLKNRHISGQTEARDLLDQLLDRHG